MLFSAVCCNRFSHFLESLGQRTLSRTYEGTASALHTLHTIEFFKEIGIYPLNRNGYLYPRSNQAQSVVDVLCMEAASLGVKIKTNEQVTEIKTGTK